MSASVSNVPEVEGAEAAEAENEQFFLSRVSLIRPV